MKKGIILAGGTGSRLWPLTRSVSKQLLPVYDKPLIYYPLSTLMTASVRDILVITTPGDGPMFERLLGDGSRLGMKITYAVQHRPGGLAEAFLIGAEWIDSEPCAMILGDNIFHGHGLGDLANVAAAREGATVFGYQVDDPSRYGIVTFDENGKAVKIEEKPKNPQSNWSVTGIYFYDHRASQMARQLTPSPRNELEITDLNRLYLEEDKLNVVKLDPGSVWMDCGTHESLLEASQLIAAIQKRSGVLVGCPEEIAFKNGWIDEAQLREAATPLMNTAYGRYLMQLVT